MKKLLCMLIACTLVFATGICAGAQDRGYVIADASLSDSGVDAADALQALIDGNPNRTIFLPDGVYLLSRPLCTPADPQKSVDLQLSRYAVLRAAPNFEGEALVRLGGKDAANDTHTPGSNYSLTGGVLDCSGLTGGVTIESGRETAVREVSIKNAIIGLHIFFGANSGSSDADVRSLNIIGTGGRESVGILVDGYDNTFTDIRIGYVFQGVVLRAGGNVLRNVHPLYYSDYTDYEESCGFYDESGSNLYDYCYSDQFCNGFWTTVDNPNVYTDCFCFWYSAAGGRETAFRADGRFQSNVTNTRISFRGDTVNTVLKTPRFFGKGTFDGLIVERKRVHDHSYLRFVRGTFWWWINQLFG